MTEPRVAARYAEGLFRLAQESGSVQEIGRELEELVGLIGEADALRMLLERPDLATEQKLAAIRRALGDRFSQTILALLATLVRHQRGDGVDMVASSYADFVDRAAGVVRANARTVVPLAPQQRARLLAALQQMTGRPVKLDEQIDPSVLAGVRLEVGDSLIDGSAAGRLARMREELLDERG